MKKQKEQEEKVIKAKQKRRPMMTSKSEGSKCNRDLPKGFAKELRHHHARIDKNIARCNTHINRDFVTVEGR